MERDASAEAGFLQATLNALPAYIVVLAQDRTILSGNAAWRRFADEGGRVADSGLGQNYLTVLTAIMGLQPDVIELVSDCIASVASGRGQNAWAEYCCPDPCGMRWFVTHVAGFASVEGLRLVISHHDMSDRKRAEQAMTSAREAAEVTRLEEQLRLQEAAAIAERNRLARELHDAVTQTLFSVSIMAEALPRVWDRDPEEGRRRLDELRQLTRGALAEMRALLLELRPGALGEKPLGDLLRHLAEAMTSRTRVPVTINTGGSGEPPLPVKIAFYRIAQEAFNNIAKHAAATEVAVDLRCASDGIMLSIVDNGVGFDTSGVLPDQLGVAIMRERAEGIGAQLTIDSQPGHGTRVGLAWRA